MRESKEDLKLRREIHAIQDELAKLAKDFSRFNERVRKLEAHIQQAYEDVAQAHTLSEKIVKRFGSIKKIEEKINAASIAK